ncbi:helix-turn-helix transcriptional regulator [Gemmiger sp.]|uniref:helix-turn-helix domain-containing protein n=1 Tax=Gemmiger sp. TaxID=2049027 RepID=UPI002A7519A9|nr:helix-turn-helix transcriptional regulator [Gemmiger sp.]MDY2695212.1 helix-turn-helix transcriptional regulator [Gemmiger sp.]
MTLGQNIQTARKAKGISQEALAEKIGVSRQALGKWEKDTALPGVDNLQALAKELGVSVDALLGCAAPDTAAPAVTLNALRDLLDARDAEACRRRRGAWLAAAAAAAVLLAVGGGMAARLQTRLDGLAGQYGYLSSEVSRTNSDLSARMQELQNAVRQGESTVLDWGWHQLASLQDDGKMPVEVYVKPRTEQQGAAVTLCVTNGSDTALYAMQRGQDGVYKARELVFTLGQDYALSVQWTNPDGTTVNENLDTVPFTRDCVEPEILMVQTSGMSDHYRVETVNGEQRLTLAVYPIALEVCAPGWMQIDAVEAQLWQDGADEPTALAVLQSENGTAPDSNVRVYTEWNGNFYNEDTAEGWPYLGGGAHYTLCVRDADGNEWTREVPLYRE